MALDCDGYCWASVSADENDFIRAFCVASLMSPDCGEAAILVANAEAYPAARRAPRIDCMIAPPRSRCRSAVPDAIPALLTGTDPVREWEAGVPANPTPAPTKA